MHLGGWNSPPRSVHAALDAFPSHVNQGHQGNPGNPGNLKSCAMSIEMSVSEFDMCARFIISLVSCKQYPTVAWDESR